MVDINNPHKKCHICKQEYTSIHTEVMPGVTIYVCNACLETARENFIWLCMGCGTVYVRPKRLVLDRLADFEMKQAYMQCEDMQIIQGIDMCISCDPEGILNYMDVQKSAMEC